MIFEQGTIKRVARNALGLTVFITKPKEQAYADDMKHAIQYWDGRAWLSLDALTKQVLLKMRNEAQ